MRIVATILMMVQLLVRGAAVSHCHAHDDSPGSADHASRPHLHVLGHSHSHGTGHQHAKHGHSHDHQHPSSDAPVEPDPLAPGPLSPEHDQDAVYIDGETLAAPVDRVQAPEPTAADWCLSDFHAGKPSNPHALIEHSAAGPPGEGISTPIDLLPHLLRV